MAEAVGHVRVPRVLAIAGTDPSGGAGLVADVKAVTALGGYAMGVVTAVTVQNTTGVFDVYPIPVSTVLAQLDAVADDVVIDAVKIGMLGRAELVSALAGWLADRRPPNVVLDPVMVATTGGTLSDDEATLALAELAAVCDLLTPNVPELGVLSGHDTAESVPEVVRQAEHLSSELATAVLATTGDLPGSGEDVLVDGGTSTLPFVRVDTPHTHGTGCSMSSALATARVSEESWEQAYLRVRPWLDGALTGGLELGVGRGVGPVDHNWFLHR